MMSLPSEAFFPSQASIKTSSGGNAWGGPGKIVAYWNASKSLLGDFYLGGSIETGNVWTRDEDIDFSSLRLAGSVFIGYDSFFGPVYLAFGHADGGNNALYLYLGRTF